MDGIPNANSSSTSRPFEVDPDDDRLFATMKIPHWLREAYLAAELRKRRQVLTVGLVLGMFLFPGFVVLDATLMPEIAMISAIMRFGVALPLAGLLLFAIRRNLLSLAAIELAVCSLMWLVAAMVCYIVTQSTSTSGAIVSATGVNVIMMFLTVIFQPPIRHTASTSGLIILVLAISMAVAPKMTADMWSGIMTLAFATTIPALYAGWYIGNERKRQFLSAERDRRRLSEMSAQNAWLHRLSNVDPLTGLSNRRAFDETLRKVARTEAATGGAVAVAMIDIDFFKQYNDHYGHGAGDECLCQVARALSSTTVDSAFVGRLGGEEFAVILPSMDPRLLALAGETIRSSVDVLGLPHHGIGSEARVTISVGIRQAPSLEDFDLSTLMIEADLALYEAKRAGRNRVHIDEAIGADTATGPRRDAA